MMEQDIRAVLDGLTLLVGDTKEASQLDAMRNYAAIMVLCADLRRSADEYKGTRNITMVTSELENHMAAVAGLDRKSTRLNSSHVSQSRMPSSA